jgi:hypothetical protein
MTALRSSGLLNRLMNSGQQSDYSSAKGTWRKLLKKDGPEQFA